MTTPTLDRPLDRPAAAARPPSAGAWPWLAAGRPTAEPRPRRRPTRRSVSRVGGSRRPVARPPASSRPLGACRPVVIAVSHSAEVAPAGARPMRTRLTVRGRRCLVVLAVAAIALAFWGGRALGATASPDVHGATGSVVVQPGDTLWSIAQRAVPSRDPRDTVQQLMQLNRLRAVEIRPGQQLRLPAGPRR